MAARPCELGCSDITGATLRALTITGRPSMPYDAHLADRVRSALSDQADRACVREVKMFGGLALMVADRMVVCVSSGGGDLLVRVAPDDDAELITTPGARRATMGKGRPMGEGWIAVDKSAVESDDDLRHWIQVAFDFHARHGSGGRSSRST